MKTKYLFLIVLTIASALLAFNSKSNKKDIDLKLDYSSIQNKFLYKNLTHFEMDTIEWERRHNVYQRIDTSEFYQIFQDTSLVYQYDKVNLKAFYSSQKTNRKTIEFTILYQQEGSYCEGILYQIYNLEGHLISSFLVAGNCSDGGYFDKSEGEFINDSVYILTGKHNYSVDIDSLEVITNEKTRITINYDGTVKSELFFSESK